VREFWVASGHHLCRRTPGGWLGVTDELLLAWLARPEAMPPEDACMAERALHARLKKAPRDPVAPGAVAAMVDPDARENWGFLLRLRDALLEAGTVEGAWLSVVRGRVSLPPLFHAQLVQLILRNALDGCDDPHALRAAELFFRPQRGHVREGALLMADLELVTEIEAGMHVSPLTAMLSGGVEGLDVMGAGNAWTYWSRSDAHTMALNFGGDPLARAGLAQAIAAFVTHLTGAAVVVAPLTALADETLAWYVGLDRVGASIGDALWRGEAPASAPVGLFTLAFLDPAAALPGLGGRPVHLILGMEADATVRLKPQNLVAGLPLARPLRSA
jgi:hypothetical protein